MTVLEPGDIIGSYEVVRPIGDGGFASVYLVRHSVLRSQHAVKMLDPRWLADGAMRDRFLAEGRILAQLSHPNLVNVTDVIVEFPERVGLVMAYVEGPSLAKRLSHAGRLGVAEAATILRGVLAGVQHAHEARVVHRDLKPDNILLVPGDDGPRAVVVDFGIAKVLDGAEVDASLKQRTRVQTRMGTPGYMSPEQVEATHSVDARTDIFALGAILYEMVSGRPAFDGRTTSEILFRVSQADHADLEAVPEPVRAIVARALALEPEDRFPTATAFREALRPLAEAGAGPIATSAAQAALVGATIVDPLSASPEPRPHTDRSTLALDDPDHAVEGPEARAIPWIPLALLGFLAAGMAGWSMWPETKEPAHPDDNKILSHPAIQIGVGKPVVATPKIQIGVGGPVVPTPTIQIGVGKPIVSTPTPTPAAQPTPMPEPTARVGIHSIADSLKLTLPSDRDRVRAVLDGMERERERCHLLHGKGLAIWMLKVTVGPGGTLVSGQTRPFLGTEPNPREQSCLDQQLQRTTWPAVGSTTQVDIIDSME